GVAAEPGAAAGPRRTGRHGMSGRPRVEDFPAHGEARRTDVGRTDDDRPGFRSPLAAEAAMVACRSMAPQGGTLWRYGAQRALGAGNARVADVDLRSGNQLRHLARRTAAPGADRVALRRPPAPDLPPAATGGGDDLLHALIAERQRVGDFSERGATEMEPPDRRVVVGPRQQGGALGFRERRAGHPGPIEEPGVKGHDALHV